MKEFCFYAVQRAQEIFCNMTQKFGAGFCVLEHKFVFIHNWQKQVDGLNYLRADKV